MFFNKLDKFKIWLWCRGSRPLHRNKRPAVSLCPDCGRLRREHNRAVMEKPPKLIQPNTGYVYDPDNEHYSHT